MAFEPLQIARVVAEMTDVNGSSIQNVYHYIHNGAANVSYGDFLAAVETFLSAMYAEIEALIPTSVTPYQIVADQVQFVSGKETVVKHIGIVPWTTWSGGTGTSEGLPQGVAGVINLNTGQAGVQGRKYPGPFTESAQNGGLFTAGSLAALAAYAFECIAPFLADSQSMQPGVMSTKLSTLVWVTSSVVNAIVGYQRRRKSGVGA